jgi:hypothetical protein
MHFKRRDPPTGALSQTQRGSEAMKQILIVQGPANAGKSTSLKLAYLALLKWTLRRQRPTNVHYLYSTDREVAATILIGSVLVGISTRGDNRQEVTKALDFFRSQKCKIIICATRSGGAPLRVARVFAADYKFAVKEIIKQRDMTVRTQNVANGKISKQVRSWAIGAVGK